MGVVSTKEPFKCLINQGLILGEVGATSVYQNFYMFMNDFIVANKCCNRLSILHIETMKADGFLQTQTQV
jgi:hypothetical protein